ncbi:MAG: serine/threonine-protein kinase [Polyangiaceae bacterium]
MKAERVGKYHLIALLGQGGMASVYLSLVPGPLGVNKLLVVKVLREDLSQDTDFLGMFLNEARLAARLNHANVVQTYEIGMADGRHFLAMDYLDGQPLNSLLRKASRKGMPLDIHLRILSDMLAGLHYAHTLTDFDGTPLHVVHRDVSPQNVFVTYDGHVKVVDFGIAKAAGAASTTQSGTFKGKLAYAAPEQAGGDVVDARADVFSAGVMLWEAIAKRRFAPADDQAAMLGRRLTGNEPKIRDAVPNVDPELADICDRALALRPEDRFPSAQALRDAIEATLQRWNRHIGPQDVGQIVSELFAEERQKIRLVIDEQMKSLLRETDTTLPMPVIEAFPALRDPTPITTIEGAAAFTRRGPSAAPDSWSQKSQGTLAAANLSPAAPPAAPKTRALTVGIAVFAVVLAGGLGAFFVTRRAPAAPAATPSDSAGDAAQITLSITFGPPGAVAKLDGVPLSESPFVAHVKRDGSMHRIDVEGPGMKPETRMVSYVKDVAVELSLKGAEPAVTAEPTVSATASAAPSDTGKRPPGDGKAPPKKPLGIDEQDPYKK